MKFNGNRQIGAALLCAALLVGLPFFTACGGAKSATQPQGQTVQVRIMACCRHGNWSAS